MTTNGISNPATKADVDTPCAAYREQEPDWKMIAALLGGTRAMREAGRDYLPMEEAESTQAYNIRLKRTFLLNETKRTRRAIVGRLRRKPVVPSADVPKDILQYFEDIDLQGNDINSFVDKVSRTMIDFGIAHVLVDYPRVPDGATRADERSMGARPFAQIISPRDVIGWRQEIDAGRRVLAEVRYRDTSVEPEGEWGERVVRRVWVLRAGEKSPSGVRGEATFRVYESVEDENATGKRRWEIMDEGVLRGMSTLPWVTIYANEIDFMVGESPLLPIAELNVQHWQSSSDQNNILRMVRVPLLFGAGFRPEDKNDDVVAVSRARYVRNENATLKWVEHSGNGIDAGNDHLDRLEKQMAHMGVEILMGRTGDVTATERAIEKAQADSAPVTWIGRLEDGFKGVLYWFERWTDAVPPGVEIHPVGEIVFDKDVGALTESPDNPKLILDARAAGQISHETFLREWKEQGVIGENVDVEAEIALLNAEGVSSNARPTEDTPDLEDEDSSREDEARALRAMTDEEVEAYDAADAAGKRRIVRSVLER